MSPRLLMLLPSLLLAVAIVLARVSGNDKAPFLVLLALGGLGLLMVGALVVVVFSALARHAAWPLLLGTALPLAYAAIVIVLARLHLIDPLHWLGFR